MRARMRLWLMLKLTSSLAAAYGLLALGRPLSTAGTGKV